ncbi:MAG TPA: alpha/beta hydrolase, partial [Thermoanaerobaculia bacterium]
MLRFLVALLVTVPVFAGTFTTYDALEYASPGGEPLLMDLRVPTGAGPHPVILYLHSGAWITGDRTGGPAIRQTSRGYAVASIDYRLAPEHIWPAQIEDAKAAVRWLRANAARFRLDPNRIGVFGSSAGGHIGAVLGTSGGVASVEGLELGNPQFSSRVKVVVDLYGPTDLLKIEEQKLPCIPLDGNAPNMPPSLLMGCPIQE